MLLTTNFFAGMARRAFRKTRETIGDVSADLQEDIAGIKVAQAFNRTGLNQARFAQRNAANRDANVGATAVTSAFSPAMDMLSTVATVIVVGFGGYLALNGQVTVGMVVAFLGYVQQFFWPIQQVSQLYTQAQSALAGGERIFELLDTPRRPWPTPRDAGRSRPSRGAWRSSSVDFAYDPVHPVLHGVSLVAEPGQTVALVGPTGAGKTTIANLIARFYDVTGGRVTGGRRTTCGSDLHGLPAEPDGDRAPEQLPLLRHRGGQHPLRPAGRHRRGGGGGGPPGERPRLHRAAAPGLRDGAGRAGQLPQPGAAPAGRLRPGHPGRPAHPDPGRGHQLAWTPARRC